MAEDMCLIQYVRDNFGEEYINNYVNIVDDGDDTMDTFCPDFNTFTESSTFDHSSATAGASNPDSTAPFVPDLFSSLSPCTEGPAAAMESIDGPYGCSYSPNGESGLQVARSFPNNLRLFDQPLSKVNEYPMLADYIGLPQDNNFQLEDFHLQRHQVGSSQGQGFEGNKFTLDEMLQEKSAANCAVATSTSGISSSEAGERPTSFWRGKSPALLMQQLKGPSLSASSSSSEARSAIQSPTNQPGNSFQISAPIIPNLKGPRSSLNLTTLSNREYRSTVSDIKGANLPMQPVSTLSKSAPSFSGQRLLPPLGDHVNVDSTKTFRNIVSSGRVDQGQTRILRSSSFDPQLIANRLGDAEMQATSMNAHLKQRKIMPGLAILGETQRNAASGNNSWSSSSTSPGPSSNIDLDRELAAGSVQKFHYSTLSVDREVIVGDRAWKKAKAEFGSTSSEGGDVLTVDIAAAMMEQREKSQLQEKFLALLQTDSSTSKDHKAKILDDTIRYLKELRKRLNVNEADSTHKNTQASPATSSRGRKYGDGLASPIHLEDLELETAGVEISPHLNVDNGPQIEVRMMENQHVMVKLTAKDRPGLFNDIMVVLRSLKLDIQHANIRTGNNGQRHDIFAAKMQLPFFSSQSTHSIAMALNQVICATATPLASPEPHILKI
ncbi:hypothetical protein M758_5G105100 [Ceratodon purpureus]|nr:hypothetical protein M758_5G105100 [Ceratodon purpureus]